MSESSTTSIPCRRCRLPQRPWHARLADWPGTVARGTRDLCWACHQYKPPAPVLIDCARCGKPCRPYNAKKNDWPGTVARGSRDKCISCHEAFRRGAPVDDWSIPPEQIAGAKRVLAKRGLSFLEGMLGIAER